MSNTWDQRRLTITADELLRRQAPRPSAPTLTPTPSTPSASWLQRKMAGAQGWPWREIMTTAGVCLAAAVVVVLILNSGWTLPSLPRRRPVPALTTPAPVAVEPTVRVVQAEPPVIIIITATPLPAPVRVAPAPAQVAPVAPRAPVVNQPAPRPTERPRVQPTALPSPVVGGPVRGAGVSATPTTPDSGPHERLLNRDCVYPSAPQGTIIRGYYTDANGVKRDSVCRPQGWTAID